VLQLVNKFPAFYGNKLFITVFTKPPHCPYPETYIQSKSSSFYSCKINTNVILQSIPNYSPLSLLSSLSAVLCSISLHSYTCHKPSPSSLSLITLVIFCKQYKPRGSSLIYFSPSYSYFHIRRFKYLPQYHLLLNFQFLLLF